MKIGIFHPTLPERDRKVGGVEVFVHRLANHLADRGHNVIMYTVAARPPSDARYSTKRIGRPSLGSRIARLTTCSIVLNRVDWSDLDVLVFTAGTGSSSSDRFPPSAEFPRLGVVRGMLRNQLAP